MSQLPASFLSFLKRYGTIIVPVVIVLVVILGQRIIDSINQSREEAEKRAAAVALYGEAVVARCDNVEPIVTGDFPNLERPPKMVILDTGHGTLHEWHEKLPDNWRATSAADSNLVICVNRAREGRLTQIKECEFVAISQDGNGRDYTVPVYREEAQIVVIDASSGNVVATNFLPGPEFDPCPPAPIGRLTPYSPGDKAYGGLPSYSEFEVWMNTLRISQNYASFITACENPGSPNGDLPTLTEVPRLLVMDLNHNSLHTWHDSLPEAWRAANSDEVGLVACVNRYKEGEVVEVGQCQPRGVVATVIRYRIDPHIVVIDPTSGEVILSDTLIGTDPPPCTENMIFEEMLPLYAESIRGGPLPDDTVFQAWLEDKLLGH